MAWYKSGSVNVTNGGTTVYGNGTLWVDVSVLYSGDVWVGPDGRLYEIASLQSNTQLTLASAYLGATANAQTYAIMPIGLLPSALAQQVKTTLSTANTALSQAVRFDANQNLTSGQKATARSNIGATAAADVGLGLLAKSVAGGVDVVLSTDEAANLFYEFTGALTANINVVVPGNVRQFFVRNNTTGAFTLTVKTLTGTGIKVLQGTRSHLECDGTNVIDPTTEGSVMTVDSAGNVGLGTTAPAAALDVRNSTGGNIMAGRSTNVGANSEPGTYLVSAPNGNGNSRTWTSMRSIVTNPAEGAEASALALHTQVAGALKETMRLDGTGNVGIGTTAPAAKLDVESGSASLNTLFGSSASTVEVAFSSNGNSATPRVGAQANDIYFKTSGTERMRIDTSGNVLVNTAAVVANNVVRRYMAIRGGSGAAGIELQSNSAQTNGNYTGVVQFTEPGATGEKVLGSIAVRMDGATTTNFGGAIVFENKADNGALAERMRLDQSGNLLIGAAAGTYKLDVNGQIRSYKQGAQTDLAFKIDNTSNGTWVQNNLIGHYFATYDTTSIRVPSSGDSQNVGLALQAIGNIMFNGRATEYARFDTSGNLLVGVTTGSNHTIRKPGISAGALILGVGPGAGDSHRFYAADAAGANAAACVYSLDKMSTTGRSINASGTVNAGGADYAEYMTKAEDCGVVAKGQIVGVTVAGLLTDKWTDSVSFMIKSTNPSYVGGDVWGSEHVLGGQRPIEPVFEVPIYTGPAAPEEPATVAELTLPPVHPGDEADEDTMAAYEQAQAQYEQAEAAYAQYQVDLAAYESAAAVYANERAAYDAEVAVARQQFDTVTMPAYQAQLAAFEVKLEFARQRVDRIAYCGQVPVNVTGATPGQYVVPIQDGAGIAGQLVDEDTITFAQYRRAVGVVQNVLADGRANVRVKVA